MNLDQIVTVLDAPSLRDAPVDVVELVLIADIEIRRTHSFVLPFLTGEERVAWAVVDKPRACEVWSPRDGGRVWYVDRAYVDPDFRKHGLLDRLRKHVRALACAQANGQVPRYIEYMVSAENEDMLRSAARVGFKPANYHYRHKVRG